LGTTLRTALTAIRNPLTALAILTSQSEATSPWLQGFWNASFSQLVSKIA
jgi:hypothetical protein